MTDVSSTIYTYCLGMTEEPVRIASYHSLKQKTQTPANGFTTVHAVNRRYEMSRSGDAGLKLADIIIEMVHLRYQKATARRFLDALIARLSHYRKDFT